MFNEERAGISLGLNIVSITGCYSIDIEYFSLCCELRGGVRIVVCVVWMIFLGISKLMLGCFEFCELRSTDYKLEEELF